MLSTSMTPFVFSLLTAVALAQSSATTAMPMSMSGNSTATSTAANVSAAEYTITALPAVASQPSCIFNCMVPIGLADPSGCDDVTNQCACLNAPNNVLDVLTSCVQTVCQSSTSAYGAVATSLYESYCSSVFGATAFSQASLAEAATESASTTTASTSAASNASLTTSGTATASATAKSESALWTPPILMASIHAIGGLLFLIAL